MLRKLARKKYKNDCYTCDQKNLTGANCQLGHMIPKASLPLRYKYDIDILKWQCYNCNINLGGNGARFIKRWEKETKKNATALINKINKTPLMGGIEAELYLKGLLEHYEKQL